jgi:hypothetical protein
VVECEGVRLLKKRAIVVGGGLRVSRVPGFVDAAEKRGLVLLSADEPSPSGLERAEYGAKHPRSSAGRLADVRWVKPESVEGLLSAVDDWQRTFEVVGALSMREEFVWPIGVLCAMEGWPSPGLRASLICRNKLLQRRALRWLGPRNVYVESAAVNDWSMTETGSRLGFPVVIKPLSSAASDRVRRINSPLELEGLLKYGEYDDGALIEEFIDGQEYSVESLVHNREIVFLGITEKGTNENLTPHFVEYVHTYPAPLSGKGRSLLEDANGELIAALNFETGIVHAEFRLRESGGAVLMEAAARLPGDELPSLYEIAGSCSLADAILGLAMGERPNCSLPNRVARQIYAELSPGVVPNVNQGPLARIAEIVYLPGVVELRPLSPLGANAKGEIRRIVVEKKYGAKVGEVRNSYDRALYAIIDSRTRNEMEEITDEYLRAILELQKA